MSKNDLLNTKWAIWFLTEQDVVLNRGFCIKKGLFRAVSKQDQVVLVLMNSCYIMETILCWSVACFATTT